MLTTTANDIFELSNNFGIDEDALWQAYTCQLFYAGLDSIGYEVNSCFCESPDNRPNRLRFVLPISSHETILLRSFSIMLLVALVAQLRMARNTLEESKEIFYQEIDHMT